MLEVIRWVAELVARFHWVYGATAARLTPDQKVGSSNLSALIFALIPNACGSLGSSSCKAQGMGDRGAACVRISKMVNEVARFLSLHSHPEFMQK